MKGQVRQLKIILSSEHPWYNLLNRYPELRIIGSSISKQKNICQNVIQEELLDLYRLHIKEWQQFENNFRWERQSSNPMETYKQLSLMWQEVNDGQ
jgi:hypothetical protein